MASAATAQDTLTVPLQYREVPYSISGVGLSVQAQPTPFKKEPALGKAAIKRGRLELPPGGADTMAFVWDYRKLYLDLNGNDDLTDDPAGVFDSTQPADVSSGNFHYGSYSKVPLALKLPEGRVPWLVDLNLSEYGAYLSAYASVRSFWVGKAELRGRELQVGWIPGAERRLGSRADDCLLLRDWAERTNVFNVSDGTLDSFPLPSQLFFRSALYELTPRHTAPEGGGSLAHELVFRERPADLGELKVSGEFVRRTLLTDGPCVAVLEQPASAVQRVPVGRYASHRVQLDQAGARAYMKEPAQPAVTVAASAAATLLAGGPLTNTARLSAIGNTLRLDYELRGAGGAQYALAQIDYEHPPRFAVYRDGEKIGSGDFEFG